MAMLFELVLNAGPDPTAAEDIAGQLSASPPLPAGRHRVPLTSPHQRLVRGEDGSTYHEVSLVAAGVGHAAMDEQQHERLPLDNAELSELGHRMYNLLRHCRGYLAAFVGSNPEDLVDLTYLQQEWAEELRDGGLHGLVVADDALHRFPGPVTVEPFAPGYVWMPYRGQGSPATSGT